MFGKMSATATNGEVKITKPQVPSTREASIIKLQTRYVLTLLIEVWDFPGVSCWGFRASHSTNESPMRNERPVNKQSAPDQIGFGNRPPPATIETVVAVIAHRKIRMRRHFISFGRVRQHQVPRAVTAIAVFRAHHSLETVALRDFSVRVELRRLNSQFVSGQTRETFDVKLCLIADLLNVFSAKNKNIAAMRFDKVVAELVHENLVTRIDRAACDHFTCAVTNPGRNAKIGGELFGRAVN